MRRIHELVQIIFTFSQNLFMLTQVVASAVFGIDAVPITIEVHIDAGIGYHLVGLPLNARRAPCRPEVDNLNGFAVLM